MAVSALGVRMRALMAVAEEDRDSQWIKDSLNIAIALELSTLPPYLCAYWSVKGNDPQDVADMIRGVALQEMKHLAYVCNLQSGIGGSPVIRNAATSYPTHLPGHVNPTVRVYLAGLSLTFASDVMMAIERPEHPIALSLMEKREYPTIGTFYQALIKAFQNVQPPLTFDTGRQLSASFAKPFGNLDAAVKAMQTIAGEGEGTTTTATFNGKLAHYYTFEQIYKQKVLFDSNGKPIQNGSPIQFPDVYDLREIPEGGWPNRDPDGKGTLKSFNDTYGALLDKLQKAWDTFDSDLVNDAIGDMYALSGLATTLLQVPNPDGGVYGPDFVLS
jgi:Ferritin-like